jgi:hypothetical protein
MITSEIITQKINADGYVLVRLLTNIEPFKKGDMGIIDSDEDGSTFQILIEGNKKSRRCLAKIEEFEIV